MFPRTIVVRYARAAVIDHISIGVTDLASATAFYDAVLLPLGYTRIWITKGAARYGLGRSDEFFSIRAQPDGVTVPADRCHVAFQALSRDSVERFHAAAVALGAADEGAPGLCPEYGDGYFAAFVRDLDGYRIEATLHE